MTKIEEVIEKVNDQHENMYAPRPSMKIIHQYMKEYAELYAERCIAQLSLSLNIGVEIVRFKPISKYQIKLPEHEP